jgi:hypothetical protein
VKHYGDLHADAADCDTVEWHAALIQRLRDEFPDGWALSLHAPSLKTMLNLCPDDVRVCPWVKPFASYKKNVTRAWAWEPIIVRGGRPIPTTKPTVRDWVSEPIAMRKGFPGAKPAKVCFWLFDFLGLELEDEFVDLFPGSGAVSDAYEQWRQAKSGRIQFGMFDAA